MAANLTPQYMEAEKRLKTAKTPQERLEILQEMMALMPKHKATEKLQAQVKGKISKLKEEIAHAPASVKHGVSYLVPKQGAGQVVVLGPPNTGKSMLIKALTGADPEVGDYPFTTRHPAPYMMKFENVRVQLVDLPPVTPEIMESWQVEIVKVCGRWGRRGGRGRARGADRQAEGQAGGVHAGRLCRARRFRRASPVPEAHVPRG
jgi:ATPase subunit of ABC transporter with duplicated ATPase domains